MKIKQDAFDVSIQVPSAILSMIALNTPLIVVLIRPHNLKVVFFEVEIPSVIISSGFSSYFVINSSMVFF